MGLIILFGIMMILLIQIIEVLIIIFMIIAGAGLIAAIALFIKGKKRPKGKRKRFYIPAFILMIPALIVAGNMIYKVINPPNPPESFSFDALLEKMRYERRLKSAVDERNIEEVWRLLEDGADPNENNSTTGPYPITVLCHPDAYVLFRDINAEFQILKLLLEYGAEPDVLYCGKTALHDLCWADRYSDYQYEAIKLLLEYGADVNAESSQSYSPLMLLCKIGNCDSDYIKIARLLLENGADINQADINGNTALYWAKKFGKTDLAAFLIENGGVE
jgi:hypothetical protein